MGETKKKIGEILIAHGYITQATLDEAVDYQKKYGGNITQYLIAYNRIKEEDLARCLSIQYNYPYIPLRAYEIPNSVIHLVPSHIAEKYWLVPIDRIEKILTVVMANPLDEEAIKTVEKLTGCTVQPFIGMLSDIVKAIERYYGISIENVELTKGKKAAPLFVYNKTYAGMERRRSIRIDTMIQIHFPFQKEYKTSVTKNVGMHGFLFESQNILPVDSYVVMEFSLPKEFSPYPIAAVVQVIRAIPLPNKKFDIASRLINIPKEDADKIMRYGIAMSRASEEENRDAK